MHFLKFRWWNLPISVKKSTVILVSLVPVIGVIALPVQITVDSIFYISSAKSFFRQEYADLYVWYREPGYPLFLRFMHLFGDSTLYVLLAQSFFIGLSFAILLFVFTRALQVDQVKRWQLLLILFLAINPMFFQYAGSFLQQASFCLLLSLFALMVEWARLLPSRLSVPKYLLMMLFIYIVAISTSIAWIYLGFTAILISSFYLIKNRNKKKPIQNINNKYLRTIFLSVLALGVAVAFLFIGRGTYGLWEAYKAPFASRVNYQTFVVKPLSTVPPLKDPLYVGERMLALMDIGHIPPYEPQNEIFLGASLSFGAPWSDYDSAYVNKPFSDYAPNYFVMSNPSVIGHSLISLLSPVSPWIYRGIFILSGFGFIFFAFRKLWKLVAIALIPISFSFIHAYNGTPVDRYGIPTYPFAVLMVVIALGLITEKKKIKED